jgi:hypothetical protein
LDLINISLNQIISSNKLDISPTQTKNLHSQILKLDSLQIHHFSHKPSLYSTLSGLIPLELINIIQEITLSSKLASSLTIKFLLHLNQQIYTKIWIPYCISRSQYQQATSQNQSIPSGSSVITTRLTQTNNNNSIINTSIQKVEYWYPHWIKYLIHPSSILTNPQI